MCFFAERNPPIEEVIKAGVIPKFVEFLQRSDASQLQVCACEVVYTCARYELSGGHAGERWGGSPNRW